MIPERAEIPDLPSQPHFGQTAAPCQRLELRGYLPLALPEVHGSLNSFDWLVSVNRFASMYVRGGGLSLLLAAVDNCTTYAVAVDFRRLGRLGSKDTPGQLHTGRHWISIVRHWCHFPGNRAGPVRDRGTHFPMFPPEYRALHAGRGAAIGPPSFLFPFINFVAAQSVPCRGSTLHRCYPSL
jgi:hypothetical protein